MGRKPVFIAGVALLITGCSAGAEPTVAPSPAAECQEPPGGALALPANGTPPRTVDGGTLRAESAGTERATFDRVPGTPRRIDVPVGDEFTVGTVRYRLVATCVPGASDAAPGTTRGIAYVRRA